MIKSLLVASLFAASVAGCSKSENKEPVNFPATPPVEEVKKITSEEWRKAFLSTFKESDRKTDDSGITEYYACFDSSAETSRCPDNYSSRRDGFKKVDYLTPLTTSFLGIADLKTMVSMYAAAVECDAVHAVLKPSFNGRNGWLFLNKVSFMADGEVVFEKSADFNDVKRDNKNRWVHEHWTFIVDTEDQQRLLKFANAQNKIIRLTGDKGYVTIEKQELNAFTKDIKSLVENTKKMNDAIAAAGGPACEKKL
ncbi:hypothetical protein [Comamonas sp. E6]|uniref:hypothetical protein n=1 Tax=Comamonas sp. E6 TaxID=364029 RepID=UPI0006306922|nr:hypothetical protein [Comamonas sp. E6]GAO73350.1 hypothetical protein CSE6_036_47870 [Comamonas sp. E6]